MTDDDISDPLRQLGRILRDARERAELTQDGLARRIGYARSTVAGTEAGQRAAGRRFWRGCDRVLGANGALLAQADLLASQRRRAAVGRARTGEADSEPVIGLWDAEEGAEAVRRRTFVMGLAGAGVSAVGLPAGVAVASEAARHGLLAGLEADGRDLALDEWEAILADYGLQVVTTPPTQLLQSVLVDLHQLGITIRDRHSAGDVVALHRVGAMLSSLTAWTFGSLESPSDVTRWWRTARRLAAAADVETQVWVHAQRAVMALYQRVEPADVLMSIGRVEPLAAEVRYTAGTAKLIGAQAQALGMVGDAEGAERALDRLRDVYAQLPAHIAAGATSFFGWGETRLRFTEGFTYSYLGNYERASAAQDRALALYPATAKRDPVKIELQRALCLARSGDLSEGVNHAHAQIVSLPPALHDLPTADLAERVLIEAQPLDGDHRAVAGLRQYVTRRALTSGAAE